MKSIWQSKTGQHFLEVGLVVVIVTLLVAGIWKTREWFATHYQGREEAYLSTRVAAGSDQPGQWPVYSQKTDPPSPPEPEEEPRERRSECAQAAQAIEDKGSALMQEIEPLQKELGALQEEVIQLREEIEKLEEEIEELEQEAEELEEQADGHEREYDDCVAEICLPGYTDCTGDCSTAEALCHDDCAQCERDCVNITQPCINAETEACREGDCQTEKDLCEAQCPSGPPGWTCMSNCNTAFGGCVSDCLEDKCGRGACIDDCPDPEPCYADCNDVADICNGDCQTEFASCKSSNCNHYLERAEQLREQAEEKREQADEKREQADEKRDKIKNELKPKMNALAKDIEKLRQQAKGFFQAAYRLRRKCWEIDVDKGKGFSVK